MALQTVLDNPPRKPEAEKLVNFVRENKKPGDLWEHVENARILGYSKDDPKRGARHKGVVNVARVMIGEQLGWGTPPERGVGFRIAKVYDHIKWALGDYKKSRRCTARGIKKLLLLPEDRITDANTKALCADAVQQGKYILELQRGRDRGFNLRLPPPNVNPSM